MKILKGFTLAEVLISLAVIGIIASMTLPALNANIQAQQAGPGLMKAVSELQSTVSLFMTDNNVRNMSRLALLNGEIVRSGTSGAAQCARAGLLPCLQYRSGGASGMKFTTQQLSNYNYRDFALKPYTSVNNNIAYTTPGGVRYIWVNNSDHLFNGGFFSLYLTDINGAKGPNVVGKDAFLVAISENGKVMPYGSSEQQAYFMSNNDVTWQATCGNNSIPSGTSSTAFAIPGGACGGAIADNSGQVRYRFNSIAR